MLLVDGEPMTLVASPKEVYALNKSLRSKSMRGVIEGWLKQYAQFSDLRLAVRTLGNRPMLQAIVCIAGEWYRCHVEQTICDVCHYRVSAAAVWTSDSTMGVAEEKKAVIRQRTFALPI